MPNLTYTLSPFLPFTKIASSDANQFFTDIKTLLNTTGLDDTNIQNAGITRATKLKTGTANYVLINDSNGKMSEEAQLAISRGGLGAALSLTGNSGLAITVNNGETGFTLGSAIQSTLTQSFVSDVSSLTAGEAISANDAVCLDLALDGSSNNLFRVFKADSTKANRRYSFIGFATGAATVTAGTYTWVASSNFVTSNVITYKINGRSYTTNFTTDNATTLQAVATQMATDPDVASASSDATHTVTVTGKGGLFINITNSTVTGGAAQPTITVTNTQTPSGQNVKIRNFGDLGGFNSLTVGANYYLTSAGGITATPTDTAPEFVGQALSSTVLFVNRNIGQFQFTTPQIFVRTKGGTDQASTTGQADVEHFNFTSWSAGTSSSNARKDGTGGDATYGGYVYWVDGLATSGSISAIVEHYNKTSWAADANKGTPRSGCHIGVLSNVLYIGTGNTANTAASGTGNLDSFNGSSWTNNVVTGMANAGSFGVGIVQGSKFRMCGNVSTSATALTTHEGYNGSTTSVETVLTAGGNQVLGASSTGSNAIIGGVGGSSASYQWTGSSWSSSINISYTPVSGGSSTSFDRYTSSGYSAGNANTWINGGNNDTGSAALKSSAYFNGTSWSNSTDSTNARAGSAGGAF